MKKKIVSLILSVMLIVLMLPAQAIAAEDMVYISISDDGIFVESDVDGTMLAHLGVPISELKAIKLEEYGLEEFITDNDGDGKEDITVLHLYIYSHQKYYADGAESLVENASGTHGSIFFTWFWGHDCNLNYYVNGEYPLAEENWGATADIIIVNPGDFIDIMMFSSWGFYGDSGAGFHNFFDKNGNITHKMNAKIGENLDFELKRGYGNLNIGGATEYVPAEDVPVYYSKTGLYADDAESVQSSGGEVSINFPSAGKWYVWMDGQKGLDVDSENIVSSPAYMEVNVEEEAGEKVLAGDVNGDGKINIADANIVRRYAAKIAQLGETELLAADVSGDGKVNIADANLIRRYAAKLITSFPVESE